jgi:hypothetical protein
MAFLSEVLSILLLLVAHLSAYAQQDEPRTLLGSVKAYKSTFFWGPEGKVHFFPQRFNESAAALLGGKVGIVINRQFSVSVGGWGKVTPSTFYGDCLGKDKHTGQPVVVRNQQLAVGYGYGGITVGYSIHMDAPVHITFNSLLGRGTSNEYVIEADGDHGTTFNSPGFSIVEPTVRLECNLTSRIRFEAGAGYRWIFAHRFSQLSTRELSGLSLHTAFVFGKY